MRQHTSVYIPIYGMCKGYIKSRWIGDLQTSRALVSSRAIVPYVCVCVLLRLH